MSTIQLKFRPSTVDGKEGSLFLQIIHGRSTRHITLDCHIYPHEWNERKGEIKFPTTNLSRINQLQLVNDRVKFEICKTKHVIERLDCNTSYTVDDIIAKYNKNDSHNITLFQYIHEQANKLMRLGKVRTSETYLSALNSFSLFHSGEDVYFDMIDDDMIDRYEASMKNRGLKRNTTSYYMRILRSLYNQAVSDGLTAQNTPFKNVYTGVDRTIKRAISFEDIQKIKNLDLAGKPAMEFARDIFILSFLFRGMSPVDMSFLKKSNLKSGHLDYIRSKTGQSLSIKWTDQMESIVSKYADKVTNEYLLPIIKIEDGTEYIQYRRKMLLVNRQLKKIANMAGVDAQISLYYSRHSWATIAYSKNIPLGVISSGMGHDSEQTTQIYLASISSSKVDDANDEIMKGL